MPCRCEILANLDRPENATCFVGLVSMVCFFHGKGKRLSCVATETWKHCPTKQYSCDNRWLHFVPFIEIGDRVMHLLDSLPTMGPLYSCLGLPAFQKLINLQKWTARRTIQPFLLWFYIFVTIFQHLWTSRRLSFSVTRWSLSERFMFQYRCQEAGRWLLSNCVGIDGLLDYPIWAKDFEEFESWEAHASRIIYRIIPDQSRN